MTIYIVTQGEYSDYRIGAVFSSRALAEEYLDVAYPNRGSRSYDNPDIEEWTVDEKAGVERCTRWNCRIELRGGRIWGQDFEDVTALPTARSEDGCQVGKPGFESWLARSYVSAEHAQKIAIEARQKWLREQAAP